MNHALNYSAFRFDAVIDWIEVKVVLPRPSQFRHVRDLLAQWGRPHVRAYPDRETTNTFSFRVQDPPGPAWLLRGLQCLCMPGDPPITEHQVTILAVEIALDARSVNQDDEALTGMAMRLFYRQALHAPSALGPRICPPRESGEAAGPPRHAKDVRHALELGWSIRDGERGAEFEQGWYVKRADSKPGKPYVPLAHRQHRARAEVTLRGPALPFTTLAEWRAFRFESLRDPFFAWRVPHNNSTETGLFGTGRRLGLLDTAHRPAGRRAAGFPARIVDPRRKTRPGTSPDHQLHQQVKNALERLTRAQQKA
jgi:hypothetical protein